MSELYAELYQQAANERHALRVSLNEQKAKTEDAYACLTRVENRLRSLPPDIQKAFLLSALQDIKELWDGAS